MHRSLFRVHVPYLILLGKGLLLSAATESLGGRLHLHRNPQDNWHSGQPCQFSPLLKVLSENDGLMRCTSAYHILENVSHITSCFKGDVRETAFQGPDSRRKWSLVSSPEHLQLLRMQEAMLHKGKGEYSTQKKEWMVSLEDNIWWYVQWHTHQTEAWVGEPWTLETLGKVEWSHIGKDLFSKLEFRLYQ